MADLAWIESSLLRTGNFTAFEIIRRTRGERHFSAGEMAGTCNRFRLARHAAGSKDGLREPEVGARGIQRRPEAPSAVHEGARGSKDSIRP